MPDRGDLEPGTVLFDYRILESAGKGGSATIYKAQHLRLPMLVAVKQLKPELTEDEEILQGFLREAAIIAQLRHPNVVRIHNLKYDPDTNLHYIITEFAEKGTLADLLDAHPQGLPIDEAVHVVMSVCDGLEAIHRRGIVHRDIKPSNVLLFDTTEEWDTPKICDFGIAREYTISDLVAISGSADDDVHSLPGTFHYMSPEQLDKDLNVDHRSDIYSVGILLYQLLVGSVPFAGEPAAAMWPYVYVEPRPPSEERREVPVALDKIVLRALSQKPEHRYQSAAEMRRELEALLRSAYQGQSPDAFEHSLENIDAYCRSLTQRAEYARWADRAGLVQDEQDHFIQTESRILPLEAFPYEDESGQRRENLLRMISQYDRLLVLGDPGVGKTAALERLVWETAHGGRGVVPVHISLSEYSRGLLTEVYQALVSTGDLHFGCEEDLNRFLRRNQCLFLFDGLNEVRGDQRKQIVRDLGNFIHVYRHHRYVITSRPQDPLWGELRERSVIGHAVVIQRITDAQVKEYLIAHLGLQKGSETYDSLNDRLLGMSRTLLFLWMLKEVRKAGGEVPGNRGELFDHYVEYLFTRDESKLEISLPRSVKKEGLAYLAFELQQGERVACQESEAVRLISESRIECDPRSLIHEACLHGLLIGGQQLRYMHQAMQDYFVAIELRKRFAVEQDTSVLQQIGNRLFGRGLSAWARDDWWAESFVQLSGLIEDPSRLAEMLNKNNPWLALWCVIEGRPVAEEVREAVEADTVGFMQSDNLGKRKRAIRELARIKNPRTAQYLVGALRDESSEVVEAAVRGLSDLGEPSVEYLLPLLGQEEGVRQAATRVLGMVWQLPYLEELGKAESEARLQALEELERLCDMRTVKAVLAVARWDSDVAVRQQAIRALGTLGDAQTVGPLLDILTEDQDPLRIEAAFALGHIGDERAVASLSEALMSSDELLRRRSMSALGQIWGLPTLIQLGDDREFVRRGAALDLKEEADMRLVMPLIATLRDGDGMVCAYAASALGRLTDSRAIKPLIAVLLSHREAVARASAASALGELGGEQILEPLSTALHDPEPEVRREAAGALGKQRDPASVVSLVGALTDRDLQVRRHAVSALGGLEDERAIRPLIRAFRDKDVAEAATASLVQIGEPAVDGLIEALQDPDQDVRINAVKALGRIGNERAFETLMSVLGEEREPSMRATAALALGRVEDARAVQALAACLREDGHKWVRFSAVVSLGQIGGPQAVEALIETLRNPLEDESVWRGVIDTLGRMWSVPSICRLCDKDPAARSKAAVALGQLGDERAIEPLLATLRDKQEIVRRKVIGALGQIWGLPALCLLGSDRVQVRQRAALELADLGDARVIDPLIVTLRGESKADVRKAVAQALGMTDSEKAVEPLIEALDDEDKDVRREAADALQKLSHRAIPYLVDALQDSNHWLRRRGAAEALGRIREPKTLVKALHHHDRYVRRSAIEALTELNGVDDVESVVDALDDHDHYVRRKAAEVLGHSGSLRARVPLQRALENDQDWRVRRAAAEALSQVGDASTVEALIAALQDDDWLVREMAAKALGRIRDERAVLPLIEALEGDWPALWTVVEALGQHGDARAIGSLTAALQARDEQKYVRDAAVEALGWIGEPIQESLIGVLRSQDEESRRRAIEALGQMRDAQDLTPLIDALRHGNPYPVHQGAVDALIRLGETAVEVLIAVLRNPQEYDAFARQRVVYALGQIGDRRAVRALIDALSDRASIVRKEAQNALNLFNTPEARAALQGYRFE